MSIELYNLSLNQKNLTLAENSILNILALRSDEKSECWPSISSLSLNSSADRKTVIKVIKSLIDKNLITKTGEMKGKTKRTPVYKLTLNSPKTGIVQNLNSTTFSSNGSKTGTVKWSQKRDMERSLLKIKEKEEFSIKSPLKEVLEKLKK